MKYHQWLTRTQRMQLTIVGVLLGLLSAYISYLAYQYAQQDLTAQFRITALSRLNALEGEIGKNLNVIVAMKAYFLASKQVERQEFRTFTEPWLNTNLSIQALEWIPHVSHSEREIYEAQVQKDGLSDYSIVERTQQGEMILAEQKEDYYPVHFVEPLKGNERVLGFDLASNPSRKQALEQARDQGKLVATDPITLVQGTGQQLGFLVVQPVFQPTNLVASEEKNNTKLQGFALGVYQVGNMVSRAMEQFDDSWVQVKIDMGKDHGLKPLYGEASTRLMDFPNLVFQRDLHIGEKIWRVQLWPTDKFIHANLTNQWMWISPLMVAVSILLLSLLGTGLVHRTKIAQEVNKKTQELSASHVQLAQSKEAVEALNQKHREDHARLWAILETASEGIITINEQGLIESANASAERIFQYRVEELKGHNVSMLMPSPYHEEHDGYLASYRNTGQAKIIGSIREVIGRRKSGEVFPMELSLSEVKWGKQRMFTGFVRDISERKESEAERDVLNKQLVENSRRIGMADVAAGVLHNVGNVLNSVNVAAGLIVDIVRRSSLDKVSRTAELLQENLHDVGNYLTQDPKGQQIPGYLRKLGYQLTQEQEAVLEEIRGLVKNIEHIKGIISVQQTSAKSNSMEEPVLLVDLMEQALSVNQASLDKIQVAVVRDYMTIAEIVVDKHHVLQVLVNLINNTKHAMNEVCDRPRVLTLRLVCFEKNEEEWVKLEVQDTGVGITRENMNRMFTQGFTTKKDGHGFGLHSGALSAKLMGGSLTVWSEGEGRGAIFTLTLPAKKREVGV